MEKKGSDHVMEGSCVESIGGAGCGGGMVEDAGGWVMRWGFGEAGRGDEMKEERTCMGNCEV